MLSASIRACIRCARATFPVPVSAEHPAFPAFHVELGLYTVFNLTMDHRNNRIRFMIRYYDVIYVSWTDSTIHLYLPNKWDCGNWIITANLYSSERSNDRFERFTIRYYGDFMIHLYRNCLIMQLRKFGWIFTELKCFHFIYIETFASTLCNNGTVEIRFDLETIGFTILRCFRRLNWLYDLFISKLSYLLIIMKLRKFGWIVARLQTSQRTEFKCFHFIYIDTA